AVPGLALSGQLDASHLAYTFVSGVAGGLDVPASARVSYVPMRAVAEIGDTPPIHAPHVDTDPPNPPGGQPPPVPHDNSLQAAGHDTTALADHPRPEHLAADDTPADSQPSEPGTYLPQPYPGGVIVGEVTRRHDTPLYSTAGHRAEQGGTLARPPQNLPAERTPIGEAAPATPRAEAANPGSLPRTSLLPATVPAVISAPSDGAGSVEQDNHHGQESGAPRTAEPASTGQDGPERPLADDSALPASHPPREHGTPPATDPQTSTLSEMPHDRTGPAPDPGAGPLAARLVTSHGDRPGETVLADPSLIAEAAASIRQHSSEQGERPVEGATSDATADVPRTGLQGEASVPPARSSALPENPRRIEPATTRVADLLSRDGEYDPISGPAWEASYSTAVDRLTDTMRSSTKDMLGVGRRKNLQTAIGDPGSDLILSEVRVMGRTLRTWQAVERSSVSSFVESSRTYADEQRRIIRQIPFDSPEAHHTARRLAVEELLRTWGYGASEMLPDRLAMHMAALDEFGLTGVLDLATYGDGGRNRTARMVHARSGDMLRDFLRQQYEETQRELERRGIEELVLYRGMTFNPLHPVTSLADAANGDVVQAPPALPLQAWSTMPGVAKRYTGLGDGAVMAGVFPASRVLSTPWTGMGQLPLNEFVLLATPGEVTVLRPPQPAGTGPEANPDLPAGWQVSKPGDGWTQCEQGHRHWGTGGGAGLLPFHRGPGGEVRVLMQLRSMETHHGGTWGLHGGARHPGENPIDAALREAGEENRLDPREVNVRGVHHDDHGGWAFDTVIGEMPSLADVWPASRESLDNAWVPLEEVSRLKLHPDLARAWPDVRAELERILADPGAGSRQTRPLDPTPPAAGAHQVPGPPIVDGFSPIADPRPRNFAEAAAIVHRWPPGNGRPHRDGTPNRIERLLSSPPESTDPSPPAVPDEELLAEGRRLAEQLPVNDESDTTARALASMSRSAGGPNPRRAIHELAAELGLSPDLDALVEVFNDAQRHGMSPDSATDRTDLTGILRRSMAADHYRWTGYRHQSLFSLRDATATQARTVGLMIGMMGDPVTQGRARNFIRPALDRYGIRDVRQLLPVVRAAHNNGYFPAGTIGDTGFLAGMDRFWQEDPYLWNGVVLAERHSLPELRDPTARLTARLEEIVTISGIDTVPPLERLAHDVGQGRSIEHLVRLAEDAQAHGADLARAADHQDLTGRITAYRARDPYLWGGLRIAAENGITHPSQDEARALSRLAEITGSEPSSRLWVFDPLRRLAGEAGLDHSVERLARSAVEAQRNGFDLFGPVDRRQVLDALTPHVGRLPDPQNVPPGLHDLSASIVRDARQAAIHEHTKALQAYRRAHPGLSRALSRLAGSDPLAVAEQERVASLEARVKAWQRWPDRPEASFTRDFAAFRSAYDQAVERAARGEAVIPYMLENATASLAARDGGRGFGLELEFDLPQHIARQAREAIARALHKAGLTGDAQVHGYHTAQGQSYRSGKNGGRGLWKLELDGTVAGELVSPILYDEPATWENLRIACEIIRSHGGTASSSTGGHVHVSTHDYDHIVENYASVLNYVGHHTDTLFRLGHNPERESHRGLKHCHPNPLPAAGYESVAPLRHLNSGHNFAVNMQGMKESSKDHIEFRLWDGSLDPAVIQSQAKVSLALVEAAFRNATLGDLPNRSERDPLGAHAELLELYPGPDLTEWGSLSFRSLMDELFWRAADKEQLTALYAATRWVRPG
ncbi:NUDIX domain-containing protein, partial [Nonomuraea sp. NPDC049784]|uniref:NUDIX domain-containing protein n=1 Tax=Nonomuraea sp. NPDC049784 TaxID=3154361 RepID=UPI0033FAD8AE